MEESPLSWCTKVVHYLRSLHNKLYIIQISQFLNYHYFSKIRGIKPKIDKLTNSTQLYPSLESKKSWLLLRGDLWSRDLLVKTISFCNMAGITMLSGLADQILHSWQNGWPKMGRRNSGTILNVHVSMKFLFPILIWKRPTGT